jgi:hypothetical protein
VPTNTTVTHFRVDTRRLMVSAPADVDERTVAALQPVLSPGTHKLPHRRSWTARTSIADSLLTVVIHDVRGALVRMRVVLDGRDFALVVEPPRVLDLPTPACVIEVLKQQSRSTAGRLWSLVEAIAWAWVKYVDFAPAHVAKPKLAGITSSSDGADVALGR